MRNTIGKWLAKYIGKYFNLYHEQPLVYKGSYDAGKKYKKYDVVRVVGGFTSGVWLVVSESGSCGIPPVLPEPNTDKRTWEQLAWSEPNEKE